MDTAPAISTAWQRYLDVEASRPRAEKISALRTFLAELRAAESGARDTWADQLLDRRFAQGEEFPVRVPLLQEVLVPRLLSRYRQRDARAAFLLAQVHRELSAVRSLWGGLEDRTEFTFLEDALRFNPSYLPAKEQLIQSSARYIAYTLHELPDGVLYGNDGATAEQCRELLEQLDDFEELIAESGDQNAQSLAQDARFHYRTYLKYLEQKPRPPGGYAAFLQSNPAV